MKIFTFGGDLQPQILPSHHFNVKNFYSWSGKRDRFSFLGVVLAGGLSTRMGEDKSRLIVEGRQLWERQALLLEAIGADAVVVSGPEEGPWAGSRYRAVADDQEKVGPMGGIFSVMQELRPDRVLVLAVDMPQMEAGFLLRLLDRASECGVGVVPRVNGFWEPLAAVYSQGLMPLLREHIESSNFELQKLVDEGVRRGLVAALECPEERARSCFLNVNTLQDWQEYIQES